MRTTPRVRKAAVAAAVGALAFAVFAPTLTFDFVYDDVSQILGNPWLWNPGHLGDLLTKPVWSFKGDQPSNYFRPVQMLLYFVDAQLFGRRPLGFHLTNVLVHALAAMAAFFLLGRVTEPGRAAAAALLFAAHPAHVESVAWISGSTDVNCGLLVFGTLVAGTCSVAATAWRRAVWLLITGALFFAALMAKETAIVTAVLALALAASPRTRQGGSSSGGMVGSAERAPWLRDVVPLALVLGAGLAAYLVLRLGAFGGLWNLTRRWEMSTAEILASALSLLPRYLLVAFLPVRLVPDRVFDPPAGLLDPWSLAGAALLGGAAILTAVAWRRAPAVAFGTLLLILPLLPVLQVQLVGENAQADRYLYIPSLGACLLLVEAGGAILARCTPRVSRHAGRVACCILLALATAGTLKAASIWSGEERLCLSAIALEPRTVTMRLVLSGFYDRMNRVDEAWRVAAEAAAANPRDRNVAAVALTLRAQREARTPQEEIAMLRRALEVHPLHAYVWGTLSAAYLKARLYDEAADAARRSLTRDPGNAQVLVNLASALGGLGDHAGQEREAQQALFIDPLFPLAWLNLGEARLARGNLEGYAAAVERAAALDPRLARARMGLSMVAWQRGRMEEAQREAERARELAPGDPEVWTWWGVLLQSAGDLEGARRAWEQALALDPQNRAARKYLRRPVGGSDPDPR